MFYSWSTNAPPFEAERTYAPLQFVAARDFDDNLSAASKNWKERFESAQALQNMICAQKKILLQQDEFGQELQTTTLNAGPNRFLIVSETLKLFSNAKSPYYSPRVVAADFDSKKQGEAKSAAYPFLTVYGTTNYRDFDDAIAGALLRNGSGSVIRRRRRKTVTSTFRKRNTTAPPERVLSPKKRKLVRRRRRKNRTFDRRQLLLKISKEVAKSVARQKKNRGK